MGKNTGNNTRKGAVKDRTQTYNPTTDQYVKRDGATGRFMSSKTTPYKGIEKEQNAKKVKTNE